MDFIKKIKILLIVLLGFLVFKPLSSYEVRAYNNVNEVDSEVLYVIELIDALPLVCSLKDEKDVKNAREAYERLTPSKKVQVTNLLVLSDRENQIALLYSKINYVISLIDNLPSVDEVDLDSKESIDEAFREYNSLDSLQKELVTNFNKLKELNNKINVFLEEINKIICLIDYLPPIDLIDINIYSKMEEIEVLLNKLTSVQYSKVENIAKYHKVNEFLEKIEALITKIDNIPLNLSKDDLVYLKEIAFEYDKLTTSQRTLVVNYQKFYKIYLGVNEALEFNLFIEECLVYINYENRYLIDVLINKYNSLDDNLKVFVDNIELIYALRNELAKLEEASNKALRVVKLIDDLPKELKLEDKYLVIKCRSEYDLLNEIEKSFVTNYHLLLEAERNILIMESEKKNDESNDLLAKIDEYEEKVFELKEQYEELISESQDIYEKLKEFLKEEKENSKKGFNKYIIVAVGLVSTFVIVTLVYIFYNKKNELLTE